MNLTCFVYEGWRPLLRPASPRRDWMDASPESYAYRCLPLSIANAGGWELLSPWGFEVQWNGGPAAEDVTVRADADAVDGPVALFGVGTFTLHVAGLFRTEPGWNLLVTGPPNAAKDGVAPLTGVIETDWSPYSFTMNWRLTRPNHTVRFEAGEPVCWFTPILRSAAESISPRIESIENAPELKRQFEAWSASRDAFHRQVAADPPSRPTDKWQKLYYRGVDPDGRTGAADHQSKLRLAPFSSGSTQGACPRTPLTAPPDRPSLPARKKQWVSDTREELERLAAGRIRRVERLSGEDFLLDFYALNRPVLLSGFCRHWPATGWTPKSLAERIGSASVQVQANRGAEGDYELRKEAHLYKMPFDALMARLQTGGNDCYLTAFNASANRAALAPLSSDLGRGEDFLDEKGGAAGMLWIGGQGAFTPLHHNLTNNLLLQLVGAQSVVLAPPSATDRLYNTTHVFSDVHDVLAPDLTRLPAATGLQTVSVELRAGDALFLPVSWWHQVRSLEFSVSLTCTNFLWPNDHHASFPSE